MGIQNSFCYDQQLFKRRLKVEFMNEENTNRHRTLTECKIENNRDQKFRTYLHPGITDLHVHKCIS